MNNILREIEISNPVSRLEIEIYNLASRFDIKISNLAYLAWDQRYKFLILLQDRTGIWLVNLLAAWWRGRAGWLPGRRWPPGGRTQRSGRWTTSAHPLWSSLKREHTGRSVTRRDSSNKYREIRSATSIGRLVTRTAPTRKVISDRTTGISRVISDTQNSRNK